MYLVMEFVSEACREARNEVGRTVKNGREITGLQSKDEKGGGKSQLAA